MALLITQTQDKMDALKNKLEKNIEIFNAQAFPFHFKKEEVVKTNGVYQKLINWVIGEFDLYLKNEISITGLTPNIKEVSVYSLLGKRVSSRNLNQESSLSIDTSALSSGIYIVKIASENASFSKKIVKQ